MRPRCEWRKMHIRERRVAATAVSWQGAHLDIDFVPDSRARSTTLTPPYPIPPTYRASDVRPRITQNTDTWVHGNVCPNVALSTKHYTY